MAVGAGTLFLVAVASIPGYRRSRRGAWALQQVARWVLRALGVRRIVHGAPRSGPSLVVGNHVSWLDNLALCSCVPMVMVVESEVRQWPVVGTAVAKIGTIFLQRDRPRALPATVDQMTSALRSGFRVQALPEATARCVGAVGQFHRASFQAAVAAAVVVSPVTIEYTDGGSARHTAPAFLGGETIADSLRRLLAAPRIEVTLRWLAPIPAIAGTGRDPVDRATVTRLSENAIASSLGVPIVRPGLRAPISDYTDISISRRGGGVVEVVAPSAVQGG